MKNKPISPSQKIANNIRQLVENSNFQWTEEMENDLPRKWKLFGDLIFIREGSCFTSKAWHTIGNNF